MSETEMKMKKMDMADAWKKTHFDTLGEEDFPTLLVSIGSGVSMIKVNSYNSYERIGGTMIGGGTLLGLSNLLTGIKDFDTIISKA